MNTEFCSVICIISNCYWGDVMVVDIFPSFVSFEYLAHHTTYHFGLELVNVGSSLGPSSYSSSGVVRDAMVAFLLCYVLNTSNVPVVLLRSKQDITKHPQQRTKQRKQTKMKEEKARAGKGGGCHGCV